MVTVVGPTLRDNAIVLSEIEGVDDLPHGWGVDTGPGTHRVRPRADRAAFGHSPVPSPGSSSLHPQRQQVWSSDVRREAPEPRYAFLGVRGATRRHRCAGPGLGGRHTRTGPTSDAGSGAFVVGVNCTEPGAVLLHPMEAGRALRAGADLTLTERADGESVTYLAEAGTDQGADLLGPSRTAPEPAEQTAADAEIASAATTMGRQMPSRAICVSCSSTPRVATLERRRRPLPDLRQLHHGVPDVSAPAPPTSPI